MINWEWVKGFRNTTRVQETIAELNAFVDRMQRGVADDDMSEILEEMRPTGLDIPFLVVHLKGPVGWAKLTLREDEAMVTGHIFLEITEEARSKTQARKHRQAFVATVLQVSDFAFVKCNLPHVFLYAGQDDSERIEDLERIGFVHSDDRSVERTNVMARVYTKKRPMH
jgi:hypothetical protein